MTAVDAHLHVWDPAVAAYDWLGSAMAPVDRAMRFREARGALRTAGVGAAVLTQAADHDAGTERMPSGANGCSRASVWDDADSLYVPSDVEIDDVLVVGGGSAPEAYGAAWVAKWNWHVGAEGIGRPPRHVPLRVRHVGRPAAGPRRRDVLTHRRGGSIAVPEQGVSCAGVHDHVPGGAPGPTALRGRADTRVRRVTDRAGPPCACAH
ncbi:hypothetical protein RKD33_007674 [Streptomyces sp. SAI-129]